ncbi:MAG: NAD-dependent epimerase/dehydratase family protein [Gordonia sp. (in: high G+C Gram-positive bacteria)]|uniref:NAD-dependent epimerase/dehydratase family protein n=1 Tax=Gordonia sp. (in: high G+C Gram-positive bacteria) TaxID=84139 RepID=UPI0039E4311F
MTQPSGRRALVFGASGIIGRALVRELIARDVDVVAAGRSEVSAQALRAWLTSHGIDDGPRTVRVDFSDPNLIAEGSSAFGDVTEVYNCAGAYRFGMSADEAYEANVATVEAIVDFAARLPALRRLIHVAGYRVAAHPDVPAPWTDRYRARTYRELGPYEASKVESGARFRASAEERGLPWTVVNPASVIGDSQTGETDQYLGLSRRVHGGVSR